MAAETMVVGYLPAGHLTWSVEAEIHVEPCGECGACEWEREGWSEETEWSRGRERTVLLFELRCSGCGAVTTVRT